MEMGWLAARCGHGGGLAAVVVVQRWELRVEVGSRGVRRARRGQMSVWAVGGNGGELCCS